jgi:DNA-binding PadR family transcriptional regulator
MITYAEARTSSRKYLEIAGSEIAVRLPEASRQNVAERYGVKRCSSSRANRPDPIGYAAGSNPSPPRAIVEYVVYYARHTAYSSEIHMAKVGEFELLVLMAVLRQSDAPYANRVREDLEETADRRVTRGALYRTLDRLTSKGLIEWEMEPSETPERGGHPMRRLIVTDEGLETVRSSREVLMRFFEGLGPLATR